VRHVTESFIVHNRAVHNDDAVDMKQPDAEPVSLDKLTCFALYAAARAVISGYRPLLDEVGLTYPQYLVLLVLWQRGPQPVKALGTALHLDSGTLSPLLKRLETAGLVRRDRQAGDERSVLVTLTAAGLDLEAQARDIPRRAAHAASLPVDQLDQLRTSVVGFTTAVVAGRHLGRSGSTALTSGRQPHGGTP
jgi:DNA-binding MarR family transcriptional regulator